MRKRFCGKIVRNVISLILQANDDEKIYYVIKLPVRKLANVNLKEIIWELR